MSQLENLSGNITRYHLETYNQIHQEVSEGRIGIIELKGKIFEKQEEMEKFPRQNSNCVEYFDRY